MGFDAFGLIAKWAPAVAACRACGGVDFYWDAARDTAEGDRLPFARERDYWGRYDFLEAGSYYARLRERLPGRPRAAADAFLGMLYHDLGEGCPTPPEDLLDDAGVPATGAADYYSMRPATVTAVLERAAAMPWREIEQTAAELPPRPPITRHDILDFDHFRNVVSAHEGWLTEAASTGRGLIVLISH